MSISPVSSSSASGSTTPVGDGGGGPAAAVSRDSSSKSDQEAAVEEVLAMLPQPWILPMVATTYWNSLSLKLGLASIGDRNISNDAATYAQALALAAVSQTNAPSDSSDPNPLATALAAYQAEPTAGDQTLPLLNALRGSPSLLTPIKLLDPSLVAGVAQAAQQQLTLHLLDNWAANIAAVGKQQKEADLTSGQQHSQIALQLLKQSLTSKDTSQPGLSIVFAGMLGGSAVSAPVTYDPKSNTLTVDMSQDSVVPVGQPVICELFQAMCSGSSISMDAVKSAVQTANTLGTSTALTSAYWAISPAVSMLAANPTNVPAEMDKKAVLSFAMTLTSFVTSPSFDGFVKGQLLSNKAVANADPKYADAFVATLKLSLMTSALAALDAVALGGNVSGLGSYVQGLLSGNTSLPKDDFRSTLVTLINQQLSALPSDVQQQAMNALVSYLNSGVSFSNLLKPTTTFLAIWNPSSIQQPHLEQAA